MKSDLIIDRITYLDAERLDISAAMKREHDMEILRWLARRKIRNESTVHALYEILEAVKYETA